MQYRDKKLYRVFSQSQSLMGNAGIFCFARHSEHARQYFIDRYVQEELERNREYYTGRLGETGDFLFVEHFIDDAVEEGRTKRLSENKINEWFYRYPTWAERFIRYHRRETDYLPHEMLRYMVRKDAMSDEVIYAEIVDYIDLDDVKGKKNVI
ncbi:hypothetical protein [Laceyella putida]|uniref:Uncharacterized protein n=1 Tax=Laceyella putida TaxID=110101 RepID=A0ABW2RKK3_9BACL